MRRGRATAPRYAPGCTPWTSPTGTPCGSPRLSRTPGRTTASSSRRTATRSSPRSRTSGGSTPTMATTVWHAARVGSVSGSCGGTRMATRFYVADAVPGGHAIVRYDVATGARLYQSPTMPGFTLQNTPMVGPDGTVYLSRTQNNPAVDLLLRLHRHRDRVRGEVARRELRRGVRGVRRWAGRFALLRDPRSTAGANRPGDGRGPESNPRPERVHRRPRRGGRGRQGLLLEQRLRSGTALRLRREPDPAVGRRRPEHQHRRPVARPLRHADRLRHRHRCASLPDGRSRGRGRASIAAPVDSGSP